MIFVFFDTKILVLLPYDYAVRLGSKEKWLKKKCHGNTNFTDPTLDLFFRRGYYHFSF